MESVEAAKPAETSLAEPGLTSPEPRTEPVPTQRQPDLDQAFRTKSASATSRTSTPAPTLPAAGSSSQTELTQSHSQDVRIDPGVAVGVRRASVRPGHSAAGGSFSLSRRH